MYIELWQIACLIIFLAITYCLYKVIYIVEICGDSMYPNYKDGEYYIAFRTFSKRSVKVGGVYVVFRPEEGVHVIKRVVDKDLEGNYVWLLGDNINNSCDSRNYGWVFNDLIKAKVKWRLLK